MAKKKTPSIPTKLNDLPSAVENLPTSPVEMFAWLIHPITIQDFFENYWEKKPLHIAREKLDYYGTMFSRDQLLHKLKDEGLVLGTEIKAMRYNLKDHRREDVCPEDDEEEPTEVDLQAGMNMWKDGYTFQVIQPQHYTNMIWKLLAGLEGSFGSLWGSNAYLTPGGTQGLAPHWDDVEVFVLQLEGTKDWTLYENVEDGELDPESSGDLDWEDFTNPEEDALLRVTLKPGDLLYFPRGTIHFAQAPKGETREAFSHHLTISTYQQQSYGQLLSVMLNNALDKLVRSDVSYRAGLPVGYARFFGLQGGVQSLENGQGIQESTSLDLVGGQTDEVHPVDRSRAIAPCGDFGATFPVDLSNQARAGRATELRKVLASLLHKVADALDVDGAVDELTEDFQESRLPPWNKVMEERDAVYQGIVKRQNEIGTKMAELEHKFRMINKNPKAEFKVPAALEKQVEEVQKEMEKFENDIVTFGPSPRQATIEEVRLANPDAVRVFKKDDECSGDKMLLLMNAFKNDRRLHMAANGHGEEEDEFDMHDDEEHGEEEMGGCHGGACGHDHSDGEEEDEEEEDFGACGHVPDNCVRLDAKKQAHLNTIRILADAREGWTKISALPFASDEEARSFLERMWIEGVVETKHSA